MDAEEGEPTPEPDPGNELRALVGAVRTALAWHHRAGAWAGSARPTHRPAGSEAASLTEVAEVSLASGERLAQIREDLGDCTRCKLHATRQTIVFGVGSLTAPLMFIGEAPGADEDRRGEPFVGKAGQLLDKMIDAMGWSRDTVYIANVLKCRPPGNRDPEADEIEACRPFLARQIRAIAPRLIVTLGRPASHLILRTDAPMSALRGRFQEYEGIKVMPTFHPAYLLRSPEKKRDTWSDLKQVIAELELLGFPAPHPRA